MADMDKLDYHLSVLGMCGEFAKVKVGGNYWLVVKEPHWKMPGRIQQAINRHADNKNCSILWDYYKDNSIEIYIIDNQLTIMNFGIDKEAKSIYTSTPPAPKTLKKVSTGIRGVDYPDNRESFREINT